MTDERPPVWVGHVALGVTDLPRSVSYWRGLGLREVEVNQRVAVLELRGGTHLVLLPSESAPEPGTSAPFDLMVDDVDATHARYSAEGKAPTEITRGHIHDAFTITDPDGYVVTVNSSHVVGIV